jgi:uncharacterized protein
MNAALTIERHSDVERFLEAAETWLLEGETENNLLLGIALNYGQREPTNPLPYWASVHDANGIVGCACRTPPHHLVLSRLPFAAVGPLAESVGGAYDSLNGVNGPAAEAVAFADEWAARVGRKWATRMRLRLHELIEVSLPVECPPGRCVKPWKRTLCSLVIGSRHTCATLVCNRPPVTWRSG